MPEAAAARGAARGAVIAPADPREPVARALLAEHQALMARLFEAHRDHHMSAEALAGPNVRFLLARDGAARPVGCAALAIRGDHGEVKSMFVAPEARGSGLGGRLLGAVEARARAEGVARLMLETGRVLHAARRLYERAGFTPRGPFGSYSDDPCSVFMEKAL